MEQAVTVHNSETYNAILDRRVNYGIFIIKLCAVLSTTAFAISVASMFYFGFDSDSVRTSIVIGILTLVYFLPLFIDEPFRFAAMCAVCFVNGIPFVFGLMATIVLPPLGILLCIIQAPFIFVLWRGTYALGKIKQLYN